MIKGKTAIITGASRSIGRAIAVRLAGHGLNVVINYAGNAEQAEITRALCLDSGGRAFAVQGDVADFTACEAVFTACETEFGPPDILINNAGITRDTLIMRMSEDDFARVLDVNLKGAFNMIKLASRAMVKARYGRIVNISSVIGLMGNAGQANYAASKAGLIGLTKSAAREFAARGITVNAVAPGFIETDMTEILPQPAKDAMLRVIPASRFGAPEDVAACVEFLISDASDYITGQVISVDGGMSM